MARPVGERIKQVLAIVDQMGEATANQVLPQLAGVCKHNVGKYCSRAVGLGLMTADRSAYQTVYRVVDGWRDAITGREPKKAERLTARRVIEQAKRQPNSVFALGQI